MTEDTSNEWSSGYGKLDRLAGAADVAAEEIPVPNEIKVGEKPRIVEPQVQRSEVESEDWTVEAQKVKIADHRPPTPEDVAELQRARVNLAGINVTAEGIHNRVESEKVNAAFQQELSTIKRDRRSEQSKDKAARDKKLLSRVGYALATLGVAAAAWFGIKGTGSKSPELSTNRKDDANEFVVKPNQVNENLQKNLENGNNVAGMEGVKVDSATEPASVNEDLQDRLKNDNNMDGLEPKGD